jgi:hypothetical protein
LEVNGESYRFKESIRRKKTKDKSTQLKSAKDEVEPEVGG